MNSQHSLGAYENQTAIGVETEDKGKIHTNNENQTLSTSSLYPYLRAYYDIQKIRIMQENRARQYGFEPVIAKELKQLEYKLHKELAKEVNKNKIWIEFLSNIRGINTITASVLLHYIGDCSKFNYLQSLYHYCGYHVVNGEAPKRKRGNKITWNPFLRSKLHLIGLSFIKARNPKYKDVYDKEKIRQKQLHPKLSKGHVHNRAIRFIVKTFLKDYYNYCKSNKR